MPRSATQCLRAGRHRKGKNQVILFMDVAAKVSRQAATVHCLNSVSTPCAHKWLIAPRSACPVRPPSAFGRFAYARLEPSFACDAAAKVSRPADAILGLISLSLVFAPIRGLRAPPSHSSFGLADVPPLLVRTSHAEPYPGTVGCCIWYACHLAV